MPGISKLKTIIADSRGNTAILFALAALPIIIMAGGAIDMTRTYGVKSKLQKAVDAAALAAAATRKLDEAGSRRAGLKGFYSNFTGEGVQNLKAAAAISISGDEVTATATVRTPTAFLRLAHINTIDIAAKAVVKRHYGSLEVALVLDNTRSMAGSKLAALKTASKDLTATLFGESRSKTIRVAVVPYAQYVNVGTDKRGAFWLDAPRDRDIAHPASCRWRWTYKKSNCHAATCTRWVDGVSSTYSCQRCSWTRDEFKQVCSGAWTQHVRWRGCVASRAYPLNVRDESPNSQIPGVAGVWCQKPILPLSADKDAIETELDSMTANVNGTYIPGGLMWGWRALSSAEPYTGGADKSLAKNKHISKALVLMTDGDNTCDPRYSSKNHKCGAGRGNTADGLTTELCANIKKAGIHVYTVAFSVSDAATKSMLQACASDASSYFDASGEAALLAAFKDISRSLATIYLSE